MLVWLPHVKSTVALIHHLYCKETNNTYTFTQHSCNEHTQINVSTLQ